MKMDKVERSKCLLPYTKMHLKRNHFAPTEFDDKEVNRKATMHTVPMEIVVTTRSVSIAVVLFHRQNHTCVTYGSAVWRLPRLTPR
jgi:hypothetical protein